MIVATIASGTKGSHAPESQTYVAKFSNVWHCESFTHLNSQRKMWRDWQRYHQDSFYSKKKTSVIIDYWTQDPLIEQMGNLGLRL